MLVYVCIANTQKGFICNKDYYYYYYYYKKKKLSEPRYIDCVHKTDNFI